LAAGTTRLVGPFQTKREALQADISTSSTLRRLSWRGESGRATKNPTNRLEELKEALQPFIGWGYEESGTESLYALDWTDYYPEVDGLGELTGEVIDIGDDAYIIIEDQVMIEKYTLSAGELQRLRAGEFPVWEVAPGPGLQ